MDFDNYYRSKWQSWKFGITFDDFWYLINEFNIVLSTIQLYNDFCYNFKGIVYNIENKANFRKALNNHRKT